jgi:hypothetical protein
MQLQNKLDVQVSSFSSFGQHDDGDVTYFAPSLRVACEQQIRKGLYKLALNHAVWLALRGRHR